MRILQNPRKFKNSPNLLLLFVKIAKFLEFSIKITRKTIVFSNSEQERPFFQEGRHGLFHLDFWLPIGQQMAYKL